jgi:hypothetical protein
MIDLSPEARSLFDAERHVDRPSQAEQARLRQVVLRRVGLGALAVGSAAGTASTMTASAAAAAGVKSSVLTVTMLCVGMGALTGGAVTAAVTLMRKSERPAEHTRDQIAAPHQNRALQRSGPSGAEASGALAPASDPRDGTEPVVGSPAGSAHAPQGPAQQLEPRPRQDARGRAAPRSAAGSAAAGYAEKPLGGSAPPGAREDVAVQVELLRESQQALRRGRPDVALARLQEHAARFPTSSLLQERQAGRVFALCALGRTEQARREAAAFVRRFPGSPLEDRVRRACDPAARNGAGDGNPRGGHP